MADPFERYQDAARALLLLPSPTLNQRAGQFLGGLMFSDGPLSDKQARWLSVLLDKHDLPALADGGDL